MFDLKSIGISVYTKFACFIKIKQARVLNVRRDPNYSVTSDNVLFMRF